MRLSTILRNLKHITEGKILIDERKKERMMISVYIRETTEEETILVNKIQFGNSG